MGIINLFKFRTKKTKQFRKKDTLVLIGTVKSIHQFETCLSEGFYHIPISHLVPDVFSSWKQLHNIKYVSIYQSNNLFKENAGIRYFGEVKSVSVVKRYEITALPKDSKALYALFDVAEWKNLDRPLKCSEIGIYPFKIVPFENYKASQDTAELMLETSEDRELYRLLRRLSTDVNFRNFTFSDFDFEDYNDNLIIAKDGNCYLQLPMEVIREMPYSGFETVKNAMNN